MMKWFSFVEWNLPSGEDCGVRSPFVSMADARELFIYSDEMILWKYEVGRVIFQVIIIMCARREICPSLSPRIFRAGYVVMLLGREFLILTSQRRGCHNYWYWLLLMTRMTWHSRVTRHKTWHRVTWHGATHWPSSVESIHSAAIKHK